MFINAIHSANEDILELQVWENNTLSVQAKTCSDRWYLTPTEQKDIEKEFLSLIPSISAYRTANMKQIYIVLMHNAARAL